MRRSAARQPAACAATATCGPARGAPQTPPAGLSDQTTGLADVAALAA